MRYCIVYQWLSRRSVRGWKARVFHRSARGPDDLVMPRDVALASTNAISMHLLTPISSTLHLPGPDTIAASLQRWCYCRRSESGEHPCAHKSECRSSSAGLAGRCSVWLPVFTWSSRMENAAADSRFASYAQQQPGSATNFTHQTADFNETSRTVDGGPADATPKKRTRGKYASRACIQCRQRKLKCDGSVGKHSGAQLEGVDQNARN